MTEEDIKEKISALEKRSKYRCDLIEEMLNTMVDMFRMNLLYREKDILDKAKKMIRGKGFHGEEIGSKEYTEAEKIVEKMRKR